MTYIIVGLGNPGRKYKNTRHNIGFMAIDQLSDAMDIPVRKLRFQALIGLGTYNQEKIILAKPQTYMNLSGVAVASLVKFYKVPLENILIIHDDLDLPFGSLRLRAGGGAGGQKGLGSIIERLGTEKFPRLRIGIDRPPGRMDAAKYVLKEFAGENRDFARVVVDSSVDAVKVFVSDGIDIAMNKFNGQVADA